MTQNLSAERWKWLEPVIVGGSTKSLITGVAKTETTILDPVEATKAFDSFALGASKFEQIVADFAERSCIAKIQLLHVGCT